MLSNTQKNSPLLLKQIARQAMSERGFLVGNTPMMEQEVAAIVAQEQHLIKQPDFRDKRDLLWVSIDNDDSEDLDQLTYAEKGLEGRDKVYVAVADVSLMVEKASAIDLFASHNTVSVYTPMQVFPMLPFKLSTDLTSLNEGVDRRAIVVEFEVRGNGTVTLLDIYPALVHNKAKLTYNKVTALLENHETLLHANVDVKDLNEQLLFQDVLAQRIKGQRNKQGNLRFGVIELTPIIKEGMIVGMKPVPFTRANSLIENLMISTNTLVTKYLTEHNLPTLRRIVRTPARWDRIVMLARQRGSYLPLEPNVIALQKFLDQQRQQDPNHFPDLSLMIIKLIGKGEYHVHLPGQPSIGHFDLALTEYAHTTAPNRRYADLIMQRLLYSHFYTKRPPYNNRELKKIAQQCTSKEDDATKVERRIRKSVAAMVLASRIGEEFPAMVTGAGPKGVWVRLFNPAIEGKLIEGFDGVDVGDRLTVKLVAVDVEKGFIDFMKIHLLSK